MRCGHVRRAYRRLLPKKRRVCLHTWRPRSGSNFGDEMSLDIVAALLTKLGSPLSPPIARCDCGRRYAHRLLAIGSILHQSRPGDTVWGSGINGKTSAHRYDFKHVDIRAVRGPLTRRMIVNNGGNCPKIYGDPGLLVCHLFPEVKRQAIAVPDIEVSLILNINDLALVREASGPSSPVNLISPSMNWRSVTAEVNRSNFVISSSLHGIILADALGVPCRPVISLFEPLFKFEDYFMATARSGLVYARSLDEALRLGPIPEASINLKGLLEAFPRDIFAFNAGNPASAVE